MGSAFLGWCAAQGLPCLWAGICFATFLGVGAGGLHCKFGARGSQELKLCVLGRAGGAGFVLCVCGCGDGRMQVGVHRCLWVCACQEGIECVAGLLRTMSMDTFALLCLHPLPAVALARLCSRASWRCCLPRRLIFVPQELMSPPVRVFCIAGPDSQAARHRWWC